MRQLRDVLAETATLQADVAGEPLRFTYRVGAVTPASMPGLDTDEVVQALANWLVGWDLMDGEEPVPIDAATLRTLPYTLIRSIYLAICRGPMRDPTLSATSGGSF